MLRGVIFRRLVVAPRAWCLVALGVPLPLLRPMKLRLEEVVKMLGAKMLLPKKNVAV